MFCLVFIYVFIYDFFISRTPIETYDPLLAFDPDLKSLPNTNTEEDRSLTGNTPAYTHPHTHKCLYVH